MREVIATEEAPKPLGPYVQGVVKSGGAIVSTAGQVGVTRNGVLVCGLREQVFQTLRNVEAVLAAGGATFEDVVTMKLYITSWGDFDEVNEAYSEFFGGRSLPPRTTVGVNLKAGLLVEADALAVIDG